VQVSIDIMALKEGDRLIVVDGQGVELLVQVHDQPMRSVLVVIEGPEESKPDNYLMVYDGEIIRMATEQDIQILRNVVRE
jgi:hypothetical protein